jgi:hypothetical protein
MVKTKADSVSCEQITELMKLKLTLSLYVACLLLEELRWMALRRKSRGEDSEL